MKKEELQKIKEWLPRGYARRIFLKTGISFMTIYSTINGKTNVLIYLIQLIMSVTPSSRVSSRA